MKLRIFAFILTLTCAITGFRFATHRTFVNPYPVVCDLVAEKIYLDTDEIKKWKKTCLSRSKLVDPYSKPELILKDISNVLALLKLSHLEIYKPSSVAQIWKGQSTETGIESAFVDSELVVVKVHPGSHAAQAGILRGDILVSIRGEQPSPWDAQTLDGEYVFRRKMKEIRLQLKTAEIQRDEGMKLLNLGKGSAQLVIPSFRAEFFQADHLKILSDLKKYRHVVVDVRGNSGGNFVAGLKLLSRFICQPTEIGRLDKPRMKGSLSAEIPEDLDDMAQLEVLNTNAELVLKTFAASDCYSGKVSVLVDGKSSSVAEMVAQALKEHRSVKLLGAPSSGELLVGVWYPVDELGAGTQISIPEAIYVSSQGHHIEGEGVTLDRVLYYNLSEMQAGVDSWVRAALDQDRK